MKKTSKDLLAFEHNDPSSLKDSALLVFGKSSKSSQDVQNPSVDSKTFSTPLPSGDVLGRLKNFLGAISEANKDLEHKAKDKPEDYNIEVLDGNESEYIEMDLMLGVADLHTPEAMAAAEAAIAGNQPVLDLHASSSSESESSNDDDSDEDEDAEVLMDGSPTGQEESEKQDDATVKKQIESEKKRKRANIVELP